MRAVSWFGILLLFLVVLDTLPTETQAGIRLADEREFTAYGGFTTTILPETPPQTQTTIPSITTTLPAQTTTTLEESFLTQSTTIPSITTTLPAQTTTTIGAPPPTQATTLLSTASSTTLPTTTLPEVLSTTLFREKSCPVGCLCRESVVSCPAEGVESAGDNETYVDAEVSDIVNNPRNYANTLVRVTGFYGGRVFKPLCDDYASPPVRYSVYDASGRIGVAGKVGLVDWLPVGSEVAVKAKVELYSGDVGCTGEVVDAESNVAYLKIAGVEVIRLTEFQKGVVEAPVLAKEGVLSGLSRQSVEVSEDGVVREDVVEVRRHAFGRVAAKGTVSDGGTPPASLVVVERFVGGVGLEDNTLVSRNIRHRGYLNLGGKFLVLKNISLSDDGITADVVGGGKASLSRALEEGFRVIKGEVETPDGVVEVYLVE